MDGLDVKLILRLFVFLNVINLFLSFHYGNRVDLCESQRTGWWVSFTQFRYQRQTVFTFCYSPATPAAWKQSLSLTWHKKEGVYLINVYENDSSSSEKSLLRLPIVCSHCVLDIESVVGLPNAMRWREYNDMRQ